MQNHHNWNCFVSQKLQLFRKAMKPIAIFVHIKLTLTTFKSDTNEGGHPKIKCHDWFGSLLMRPLIISHSWLSLINYCWFVKSLSHCKLNNYLAINNSNCTCEVRNGWCEIHSKMSHSVDWRKQQIWSLFSFFWFKTARPRVYLLPHWKLLFFIYFIFIFFWRGALCDPCELLQRSKYHIFILQKVNENCDLGKSQENFRKFHCCWPVGTLLYFMTMLIMFWLPLDVKICKDSS